MKTKHFIKSSAGNNFKVALVVASLLLPQVALSNSYVFTNDAQFDNGSLDGLNHDAPNNNQLQLNDTGTTFPVMWIANAGEDSVSKINTNTNKEEARYKTWFGSSTHSAWSGPAPSRTAVDIDGNVYIANRHFDGKPAQVMKILAEGGIDRNGNGVIDSSVDSDNNGQIDPSEILILSDSNGNGKLDDNELIDERVAWAVQIGPNGGLGRSLCIDKEGDIWLGLYNSRSYYELDSTNGDIKNGPITNNNTNYGCLVDANGKLWSANLGSNLNELDTATHVNVNRSHAAFGSNYGIAVGNNKVYLGSQSSRSYVEYDPATTSFSTPAAQFTYTLGISVDGNGDIVLGRNPHIKFDSDGNVIWATPNPQGNTDVRGVIVDANNDVWTVNLSANNISKFDGVTGNHLATIPVGYQPYTYSDATGFAARNVTDRTGFWVVEQDSGQVDTDWDNISWNNEAEGNIPAGASIDVEARVANVMSDLQFATYQPVTNGGTIGLTGRYIGVKITVRPDSDGDSPVLSDLTIAEVNNVIACDVDGDGDADRMDIRIIMNNRNQPALPGDPMDIDGNGIINANDARVCATQCTRPRCAP